MKKFNRSDNTRLKTLHLFPVLMSVVVLFGCGANPETSTDISETETEAVNGKYYYLEYDNTVIDDECASAIEEYFYSIESKNFDMYIDSIYPDYYKEMNTLLEENYSYGFENVLEELYNKLLSSAEEYLADDESDDDFTFELTEIEFSKGQDEDLEANIANYEDIFGEDFYNDLQSKSDNLHDIYISIVAKSGDNEEYILTDNEILVISENERYYVFG